MNRSRYSRSNSASPEKSPTRNLPHHHIVENRYQSYSRVEDYVKHLNKVYNTQLGSSGSRDVAYINTFKFRLQQPSETAKFKVSQFPKAKVNQELLEQQELLNAFNHISFENKSRPSSRQKSHGFVHEKRSNTAKVNFSYRKEKIFFNDKCSDCRKLTCGCVKEVEDSFLKKILKKHWKSVEKAGVVSVSRKERKNFTVTLSQFCEKPEVVIDLKRKLGVGRKLRKKNEVMLDESLRISPIHITKRTNNPYIST